MSRITLSYESDLMVGPVESRFTQPGIINTWPRWSESVHGAIRPIWQFMHCCVVFSFPVVISAGHGWWARDLHESRDEWCGGSGSGRVLPHEPKKIRRIYHGEKEQVPRLDSASFEADCRWRYRSRPRWDGWRSRRRCRRRRHRCFDRRGFGGRKKADEAGV